MNTALAGQASAAVAALVAFAAHAVDMEPPKIQLVDAMGVNMATGQVTHDLTPVSIGGAMGLSYTISIYANEARWGAEGFSASHTGQVTAALISTEIDYSPWHVMRASDGRESADFKVLVNGVVQSDFRDLPPPYTYVAAGDQRSLLEVNGTSLDWTKPDGTVIRFFRGSRTMADAGGSMTQIIQPNGFTIVIGGSDGIVSNTGYQLRPIMVADHRPSTKSTIPTSLGCRRRRHRRALAGPAPTLST